MNTVNIQTTASSATQLPDISQLPYYHQNPETFKKELGLENLKRLQNRPSHWPKRRGNYVRNYVLSDLRIQMKTIKPRMTGNLELILNGLPIELLISIFSTLHPIDLYHAICAAKTFRHFLLNKNFASIWRESFLNHPDIPFYPDDVSPPKWASLIFGPATCDECGLDNTLVDYAFLWRKCDVCADYFNERRRQHANNANLYYFYGEDEGESRHTLDRLIAVQLIMENFPDQVDIIWALSARTCRNDSFTYFPNVFHLLSKYSYSQVKKIAFKMRSYLIAIQSGEAGAKVTYDTFVKNTQASSEQRMEHALLCNRWARNIQTSCQNAFIKFTPAFRALCRKALLARGHDSRDVDTEMEKFDWTIINKEWPNVSGLKLKKSSLWKYLPQLESGVITSKQERLAEEFEILKELQRHKAFSFYTDNLLPNFIPDVHAYLPQRAEDVWRLPPFVDYISDLQISVVEFPVDAAQRALDSVEIYVAQTHGRLFKSLFHLMLIAGVLPTGVNDDSKPSDFAGLAEAVFECCGSAFVGWEEIGVHVCQDELSYLQGGMSPALARFSHVGHKTLKNLAGLLHLDSLESVQTKDLDTLNRRFVCKTCPLIDSGLTCRLRAMTWRECLCHAVQIQTYLQQYRHNAVFDILSEPFTESIINSELPFPSHDGRDVCCRHGHVFGCSNSSWMRSDRNTLTRRLEPVDIYTGYQYICLRCPKIKMPTPCSWELKNGTMMTAHLLSRHCIEFHNLVEGVDWRTAKMVEDDTWIQERLRAQEHARSFTRNISELHHARQMVDPGVIGRQFVWDWPYYW
ncbi:hypothetical protein BDN70DRAFT_988245 [Pholiota conissans]|uniref:F-box domain-containing protein n=1 Tax=Pholiota conissans TaxID=109636 RepID=A0A9P5ZH05_9AGAR|nr:hypothetical protein BDN70DRAFT_988245 [Pholiota conissans]